MGWAGQWPRSHTSHGQCGVNRDTPMLHHRPPTHHVTTASCAVSRQMLQTYGDSSLVDAPGTRSPPAEPPPPPRPPTPSGAGGRADRGDRGDVDAIRVGISWERSYTACCFTHNHTTTQPRCANPPPPPPPPVRVAASALVRAVTTHITCFLLGAGSRLHPVRASPSSDRLHRRRVPSARKAGRERVARDAEEGQGQRAVPRDSEAQGGR